MNPNIAHSRWHASLSLGFKPRPGGTRLVDSKRSGPLSVQRPFYPEGEAIAHTYLLHPPGGVVGGDRIDLHIRVDPNAHALLTTPGATKFYRSDQYVAEQQQHLIVASKGTLEWLPQESIFFDGALVKSRTIVELEADARFIGWELSCLGRPAAKLPFDQGELNTRFSLIRDGKPLLHEALVTHGPTLQHAASGLRGYACQGLMVMVGTDETALELARSLCESTPEVSISVTQIDDLLILRGFSAVIAPIWIVFNLLWQHLRPNVLDIPACAPRIWAT